MNHCILYNPLAYNSCGMARVKMVEELFPGDEFEYVDIIELDDVFDFIENTPEEIDVIVAGGDGTVSVMVDNFNDRVLSRKLNYFPAGTGNDFMKDVAGDKNAKELVHLNPYIEDLPVAVVKDKAYRVLNGIGFGIDGYVGEEGEILKKKNNKPTNYTLIAIKGLAWKYKPKKVTVTVDGETRSFNNTWLSPIMNGRYYGGGFMPIPSQDRLGEEKTISVAAMHDVNKLRVVQLFPKLFKGTHVGYTQFVDIRQGHHVIVEYDEPTPLQIDGEVISGVTVCHCYSAKAWKELNNK